MPRGLASYGFEQWLVNALWPYMSSLSTPSVIASSILLLRAWLGRYAIPSFLSCIRFDNHPWLAGTHSSLCELCGAGRYGLRSRGIFLT